jgi:hypothetical protein
MARLLRKLGEDGNWDDLIEGLANRQIDPYTIVEKVLTKAFVRK